MTWRDILQPLGIFSLARTRREAFEEAIRPDVPSTLWTEAEGKFGTNKVAYGRYIAENHRTPPGSIKRVMRQMVTYLRGQGVDVHCVT